MAETTILGQVIVFFRQIGIYEVVLPFLLVFAIVFAILEKTKVLGFEEVQGIKYTKKTLNSLVAFVIALIVVASSQIVGAITQISSQIIILILLVVFFMVSIGIFFSNEEDVSLEKSTGIRTMFLVIIFIAILGIFLNAMKTSDGDTWLEVIIYILAQFTTNTAVAAIVLIIGIILFMWFIVKKPKSEKKGDE